MIKTRPTQKMIILHAEKDIRLRIDLLEGQSSFIAKMLTRAISDHNEVLFTEYSKRLAVNRGRIDELLWVLGEKNTAGGLSVLDMQVASNNNSDVTLLTVREVIEKLRKGELSMDELSPETQTMVRKGAIEMKKSKKS